MPYDSIRTPTLLLDEAVCRRNIRRMAEKARAGQCRFRPHFKTHQSLHVGRLFRAEGVRSIAVSSVRMAEYFAGDGWEDITIAFPVNLRELPAINRLAARVRLQLLVESAESVRALCSQLRHRVEVVLKIDAGYGRTGIAHGNMQKLHKVAGEIDRCDSLALVGLLAHGGENYHAHSVTEMRENFTRTRDRLLDCARALRDRYPALYVSVGDTPGCSIAEDFDGIDEIRPGNFVFFDVMQQQLGVCEAADIAVALAVPVVALHPERNEIVVFGGAVHLSREAGHDEEGQHFGQVVLLTDDGWSPPLPGTRVIRLSQEHGIIHSTGEILDLLHVGALLAILPVHSCLTAECMRGYRALSGNAVDHLAGLPFPASFPAEDSDTPSVSQTR